MQTYYQGQMDQDCARRCADGRLWTKNCTNFWKFVFWTGGIVMTATQITNAAAIESSDGECVGSMKLSLSAGITGLVLNSMNLAISLYQMRHVDAGKSKNCQIYGAAFATSLIAASVISFALIGHCYQSHS